MDLQVFFSKLNLNPNVRVIFKAYLIILVLLFPLTFCLLYIIVLERQFKSEVLVAIHQLRKYRPQSTIVWAGALHPPQHEEGERKQLIMVNIIGYRTFVHFWLS